MYGECNVCCWRLLEPSNPSIFVRRVSSYIVSVNGKCNYFVFNWKIYAFLTTMFNLCRDLVTNIFKEFIPYF